MKKEEILNQGEPFQQKASITPPTSPYWPVGLSFIALIVHILIFCTWFPFSLQTSSSGLPTGAGISCLGFACFLRKHHKGSQFPTESISD